jgi:hypothetical protein
MQLARSSNELEVPRLFQIVFPTQGKHYMKKAPNWRHGARGGNREVGLRRFPKSVDNIGSARG